MNSFIGAFIVLLMSTPTTHTSASPLSEEVVTKKAPAACLGEGLITYEGTSTKVFVSRDVKQAIFVNLLVELQREDFDHVNKKTLQEVDSHVTKSGTVFLMAGPPSETVIYIESTACTKQEIASGACAWDKLFQEVRGYIERLHKVTIVEPITVGCPSADPSIAGG